MTNSESNTEKALEAKIAGILSNSPLAVNNISETHKNELSADNLVSAELRTTENQKAIRARIVTFAYFDPRLQRTVESVLILDPNDATISDAAKFISRVEETYDHAKAHDQQFSPFFLKSSEMIKHLEVEGGVITLQPSTIAMPAMEEGTVPISGKGSPPNNSGDRTLMSYIASWFVCCCGKNVCAQCTANEAALTAAKYHASSGSRSIKNSGLGAESAGKPLDADGERCFDEETGPSERFVPPGWWAALSGQTENKAGVAAGFTMLVGLASFITVGC